MNKELKRHQALLKKQADLDVKLVESAMEIHGVVQTCPWCQRTAQLYDGWKFERLERHETLDVLTCGVCRGKSLWFVGILPHYVGPLSPPMPMMSNHFSGTQWSKHAWQRTKAFTLPSSRL